MIAPAMLLLSAASIGPPLPLPTYVHRVHLARLALDRASSSGGSQGVVAVQAQLRSLSRVRLANGGVVTTDLPRLAGQIVPSSAVSVHRAAGQLDLIDDALRSAPQTGVDRARLSVLDAVLRDARFHPASTPWTFISDRLNDLYERLIRALADAATGSTTGSIGFALVLLAIVGIVAYLIARGAMSRLVIEATPDEIDAVPATPDVAHERAAACAAAGDYRRALRYLFLATMLRLQQQGLLELRPGMTNREYLRLLRSAGGDLELQGSLNALIDLFDETWYGHRDIGASGYRDAQRLCHDALARSGRAA